MYCQGESVRSPEVHQSCCLGLGREQWRDRRLTAGCQVPSWTQKIVPGPGHLPETQLHLPVQATL